MPPPMGDGGKGATFVEKGMSAYNHIAGQKMPRMEALADGVFSIAMTILVFDLKLPTREAYSARPSCGRRWWR
jgi:Endosomal/lysosomal potassium channel TMEM175